MKFKEWWEQYGICEQAAGDGWNAGVESLADHLVDKFANEPVLLTIDGICDEIRRMESELKENKNE